MSNVRDVETNLKRTSGLHSRKTVSYADIFPDSPSPYLIYISEICIFDGMTRKHHVLAVWSYQNSKAN